MNDYTRSGSNRYGTPKEMEDLIDKNEITDAKTIAAFEKARKYLPGL